MKIDCLVAEIGSTTTIVNAFNNLNSKNPVFLGQGLAKTTIDDVTIGLNDAIINLKETLNVSSIEIKDIFASSSSAGGLRMTVHGLVYDMTVKAAKEAALGAGANIKMITSGKLSKFDLKKLEQINPNIIMIAGGVNYGETSTVIYNANEIAALKLSIPVIYAGNITARDEVLEIFRQYSQEEYLYICSNVYPMIDVLDVNEARIIIQEVFEKHITKAKGMEKVRDIINSTIIPTPGAVMEATILINQHLGNVVTIDIGGATTDIHSVCEDSIDNAKIILYPEPLMKRTVEGDLGVFVNKDNIINMLGKDVISKRLNINIEELNYIIDNYKPIPDTNQVKLVEILSLEAINEAINRHAGRYTTIYGTSGKKKIAEGKDLTNIDYIIGTGGPLTKLDNGRQIIIDMLNNVNELSLKPRPTANILIDKYYIMASAGVIAKKYPKAALQLLKQSLNLGE